MQRFCRCADSVHQTVPVFNNHVRRLIQTYTPACSSSNTAQDARRNGRNTLLVPTATATVEQAVTTAPPQLAEPTAVIAHELIQGALARWCVPNQRPPPTAVLVHGILGSRRNLVSFARQLVQEFPAWQVLLVDLRCHGESTSLPLQPPHTVEAAAADVLRLLGSLKMFPAALIGHSFGGKVVLSMAEQFGRGARLPRPVHVWVLDTVPGEMRHNEGNTGDHPRRLIRTLLSMPTPIAHRDDAKRVLRDEGFSDGVCAWVASSLRPNDLRDGLRNLDWTMDLSGVAAMYESYETSSLWSVLHAPPQGLKVHFVKAERSSMRWHAEDEARITTCGHDVHLLRDSGHWVHTDNPSGLLSILSPSFASHPFSS